MVRREAYIGEGHDHAASASAAVLLTVLMLTGWFPIAQAIGAWVFNSLAPLSDASHMLTDALALAVALSMIRVGRRPADRRRTWGYHRFEVLAAALNASLLHDVKGACFEVWSDLLGSVALILGAVVLWLTGWTG